MFLYYNINEILVTDNSNNTIYIFLITSCFHKFLYINNTLLLGCKKTMSNLRHKLGHLCFMGYPKRPHSNVKVRKYQ